MSILPLHQSQMLYFVDTVRIQWLVNTSDYLSFPYSLWTGSRLSCSGKKQTKQKQTNNQNNDTTNQLAELVERGLGWAEPAESGLGREK